MERQRSTSRFVVSKKLESASDAVRNGTLSPLRRDWHGRRFDEETKAPVSHTLLGTGAAEGELRSLLASVARVEMASGSTLRADPSLAALPWPDENDAAAAVSSLVSARPTSSWSVMSARGGDEGGAPPTPGHGGVPDALGLEEQRVEHTQALDAKIAQSMRRRELEEKMDEAELKRLPIFMRVAAQREQRTLARWQKRNDEWDTFQKRMAKKVRRPKDELVFSRSEEHRSKEEEFELVQSAIPADQKYGGHYWLMSLRNMGTRYVQVGNIFSGLFCPIREGEAKPIEQVRRPERDTALLTLSQRMDHDQSAGLTLNAGNETSHSSSKALTERRTQLAKKLKQLRPHTVELAAGDAMMIVGVNLFEWARESTNKFFDTVLSRAAGETLAVPTIADPPSSAFSSQMATITETLTPLAALAGAGPAVEVVLRSQDGTILGVTQGASASPAPLTALITTDGAVGSVASVDVFVRNVGSTAVKCNWVRAESSSSTGAMPSSSGPSLSLSPLDGGSAAAATAVTVPFSLTRTASGEEGGATARGWVYPGTVARWRISFASTERGIFCAAWELACSPTIAEDATPISVAVRAAALQPDTSVAARRTVTGDIDLLASRREEEIAAVEEAADAVTEELVSAPRDRVAERALFEGSTSNVRAKLHYSPFVFDEFERFVCEVLAILDVRDPRVAARRGWHAVGSIQFINALVAQVTDEDMTEVLGAQLVALLEEASFKRPEASDLFPFMRQCVVELVESIPSIATPARSRAESPSFFDVAESASRASSPSAAAADSPAAIAETPGSSSNSTTAEGGDAETPGSVASPATAAEPREDPAAVARRFGASVADAVQRCVAQRAETRRAALRAQGMLLSPKASLNALLSAPEQERVDAQVGSDGGGGEEEEVVEGEAGEANTSTSPALEQTMGGLIVVLRVKLPVVHDGEDDEVVAELAEDEQLQGVAALVQKILAAGAAQVVFVDEVAPNDDAAAAEDEGEADADVDADAAEAKPQLASLELVARALDSLLVDSVDEWEEGSSLAFLPLEAFEVSDGFESFGLPEAADSARVVVVENLHPAAGEELVASVIETITSTCDVFVNDALQGCEESGSALATIRGRTASVAGPALAAELAAVAPFVEGIAEAKPLLAIVGGDVTRARLELALSLVGVADGGLVLCGGVGVAAVRCLNPEIAVGASVEGESGLDPAVVEELVLHIAMKAARCGIVLHLPCDWTIGESPPPPRSFPDEEESSYFAAVNVASAVPSKWSVVDDDADVGEGGGDCGDEEGDDAEASEEGDAVEGDLEADGAEDNVEAGVNEEELSGVEEAAGVDVDALDESFGSPMTSPRTLDTSPLRNNMPLLPVPDDWHILDEGPATVRLFSELCCSPFSFLLLLSAASSHLLPFPSSSYLALSRSTLAMLL